MNLKQQRDIGYGLLGFGLALLTGYSLSAYGQIILFIGIILLVLITALFMAMKDAVNLKAKASQTPFKELIKVTGGLYGLIFLGFFVVVLLGILRGF